MIKKEWHFLQEYNTQEKIRQIAEEVVDRLSDQIHDTVRGVVKVRLQIPREDEYSEFNKKIYSEVTSKLKHFL
jgi:hypothetical protein|tara:strand:+ start:205 stop:423 length:219 start_codon:yes stop_codon:yes gene_type:complete